MTSYEFGRWLQDVFGDDDMAARLIADPEPVMARAGLNDPQKQHIRLVLSAVPENIRQKALDRVKEIG